MVTSIEQFIEAIIVEKNASWNTVSSYRTDLVLLNKFLNLSNLENASPDQIFSYILQLHKVGCSKETITRKIITFRQFYKFLYSEKIIKTNPMLNIELPRKSKKLPKYLTKTEIKQLFEYLENSTDAKSQIIQTMLEVLYASGMRVSELITLKLSDIKPILNGHEYIIISGKGQKERLIPFSNIAIASLKKYLMSHYWKSEWLFPGERFKKRDTHISRQRFALALKEVSAKAGIAPDRVSPHVIRHSFATHLLDNGMDIKVIQDLLGHSSISTTQIYTHIANEKLQKAVLEKHPLSKK